jgi:CubicO group peptidase (beta-lactamase class C family)
MNSNKYVLALCVSLFSISAGAADDPSKADHPEVQGALAAVDAWLDGERAYGRVPGMSAGIVLDQDLIWSQGYGYSNLADKVPADNNTIYSICSISKLFTSIGVMQLRDEGKLNLSDKVADHLEWYELEQVHDGGAVDIEGILTHSSGLPREASEYYWNEPEFGFPTRQEMIDGLVDLETLYPARTWFQYSNLGLSLAGEIVAARSEQDYGQYIQDNILTPLAMGDTRSHFPAELHGKQLAIGYTGLDRSGERVPVPPFFTRGVTPAAGFTSTVRDLAKFASWQFRLLEKGGEEVLDSNTLREMHRVHWIGPDWKNTWGIGFAVRQAEGGNYSLIGHGGGCPGYITQFIMAPKYKLGVIVLTNAGDGPSGRLASGIMKTLVRTLAKAEAPAASPAMDFNRYEGNFSAQPWGGESAVRQWGNQLAVIDIPSTDLSGSVTRLKHVEGDTFVRLTDEGEERESWEFELGADGKAATIRQHSFRLTRIR